MNGATLNGVKSLLYNQVKTIQVLPVIFYTVKFKQTYT